jgi:GNAT superfamily N-acetyltransferase
MAEQALLRDGTPAWVLPLLPGDRDRLVEAFEQLSPESRRQRFLSPVSHLSESMLQHLVDEVDGRDHVALVLAAETEPGVFEPVGIGRMVRYGDLPQAADLAVTVRDEWQGRGVATALLPVLVSQRPAGVTHVLTEVASDNPASLAMLRRLGPTRVHDTGLGVYDVEVDLTGRGEPLAGTGEDGTRLHPALTGSWRPTLRNRDRICSWFTS